MPDPLMMPALREAFRVNEIGNKSPYEILFAAKGNSGGSFGAMQGDLAAGQPVVGETFRACLAATGTLKESEIDSILVRLSAHCPANPLSPGETELVNDALLEGKDHIDAMDVSIMKGVLADLDNCIAVARAHGSSIGPVAQLYIALWINMTGPPSKMITWLKGGDPKLTVPIPQPGPLVGEAAIQTYLKATKYFVENPKNWPHMLESVAAGSKMLPK